jgi:hypothetical protein
MKTIFGYVLSILVVFIFAGLIGLMAIKPVPVESEPIIYAMTGILGAGVMLILNYHFGTSSSSARKTEIMANGNVESNSTHVETP